MKTKKLLLLLTFSLLCVSVKAQTLSFDETVKYINDQISCCEKDPDYRDLTVKADRDGKLTVNGSAYKNLFVDLNDIIKEPQTEQSYIYYGNGHAIRTNENFNGKFVAIQDSKGRKFFLTFNSMTLATRVAKAFAHLQSLCTPKAKDPFDN